MIFGLPTYRQYHPPLDSFPQLYLLGLLSADFTGLHTYQLSLTYACRSIKVSVSGRYPFIPLIELSVLHALFSMGRSFSLRNVSHYTIYQSLNLDLNNVLPTGFLSCLLCHYNIAQHTFSPQALHLYYPMGKTRGLIIFLCISAQGSQSMRCG